MYATTMPILNILTIGPDYFDSLKSVIEIKPEISITCGLKEEPRATKGFLQTLRNIFMHPLLSRFNRSNSIPVNGRDTHIGT